MLRDIFQGKDFLRNLQTHINVICKGKDKKANLKYSLEITINVAEELLLAAQRIIDEAAKNGIKINDSRLT